MTRILSYNILVGGTGRIDSIERMISTVEPDVVGLVEATDPEVVKELAWRLSMEYRTNALPDNAGKTSIALLSRLPIVRYEVHPRPGLLARPLLEVCLREEHDEKLTVFVTHLSAAFARGRGGDSIRRREVREILRILRANHGPHALMGDFNALAPGDRLKASALLRYLTETEQRWKNSSPESQGHPSLNFVVPPKLRFLNPLLYIVPRSPLLSALFDEAGTLYAPRGSIGLLRAAGYVDCFRYVNPRAWGFTCPAASLAGRIDYIFANPLLATRLSACKVISEGDGMPGSDASDHLPIMAEFGVEVETTFRPLMDRSIETGETVSEAF
jgi:endonuclease/exonuclease/phosphatase family metal-dependent hydrolase